MSLHPTATTPEPIRLEVVRDGIRSSLKEYVDCLWSLGFQPPYSISLTLVNIGQMNFTAHEMPVSPDRSMMQFPEVVVTEATGPVLSKAARELTDMVYQAFGMWETY